MRSPSSALALAAGHNAKQIAKGLGVGKRRVYQMTDDGGLLDRLKELLDETETPQAMYVKCDLDSYFQKRLYGYTSKIDVARLNQEAYEVIQAFLEGKSSEMCKKEILDLMTVLQLKYNDLCEK